MRTVLLLLVSIGCSETSSEHKHDSGDHHDGHGSHGDTDLPDEFDDTQTKLSRDGLASVSYVTEDGTLPESIEFGIEITLADGEDESTVLTDASVTAVDATMPTHGDHGMNVTAVVTDNGNGTFTASPIKLHMPGYWVLHVDIEVNGVPDTAEFDIECCD